MQETTKETVEEEKRDELQISAQTVTQEEVITLNEYLGKLVCDGCGKHCPLTALKCSRGQEYKDRATEQYQLEVRS